MILDMYCPKTSVPHRQSLLARPTDQLGAKSAASILFGLLCNSNTWKNEKMVYVEQIPNEKMNTGSRLGVDDCS